MMNTALIKNIEFNGELLDENGVSNDPRTFEFTCDIQDHAGKLCFIQEDISTEAKLSVYQYDKNGNEQNITSKIQPSSLVDLKQDLQTEFGNEMDAMSMGFAIRNADGHNVSISNNTNFLSYLAQHTNNENIVMAVYLNDYTRDDVRQQLSEENSCINKNLDTLRHVIVPKGMEDSSMKLDDNYGWDSTLQNAENITNFVIDHGLWRDTPEDMRHDMQMTFQSINIFNPHLLDIYNIKTMERVNDYDKVMDNFNKDYNEFLKKNNDDLSL